MNMSRTCSDGDGVENGIMLFGVRVTEGNVSFRKSVSMNNLCQYDQQQHPDSSNADAGYASDDVVHPSDRCRDRKRGIPWSEEEHRLFLMGLEKVGKGDWRGISRNYVKTRTATQVASHAQKYFLRRNNVSRRRRRSSLFDITTDTFTKSPMEEDQLIPHEAILPPPPPLPPPQPQNIGGPGNILVKINLEIVAPPPPAGDNNTKRSNSPANTNCKINRQPIPMPYSKLTHLNIKEKMPEDPLPLTLNLSSTPHSDQKSPSSTFKTMSGGGDGIDIVSVA